MPGRGPASRSADGVVPVRHRPGRAAPTLVLIHGLFSSPLEFSLLTRCLQARRVRYELLEIPGYTRGGSDRSTWPQWVAAAREALDRRFAADEAIVVGGLCAGAAIAAALTDVPCRQSIEGLVMMSPTLDIDGWGMTRWRHIRRFGYALGIDRWVSVPEREPFGIKNERMRRRVRRDLAASEFSAVGPSRIPMWGVKACEQLYTILRARLRRLDLPLLVVHAKDDEITSLSSVKRWMAAVPGRPQLRVLEDSYHIITIDNDRRELARCLADFVGAPRGTDRAHADHRSAEPGSGGATRSTRPSWIPVGPGQPA